MLLFVDRRTNRTHCHFAKDHNLEKPWSLVKMTGTIEYIDHRHIGVDTKIIILICLVHAVICVTKIENRYEDREPVTCSIGLKWSLSRKDIKCI